MPEHALKCENNEAIFDQKQFIAFKMAFSCCFSLGGNLDFPGFLQKFFYNINYFIFGSTVLVRATHTLAIAAGGLSDTLPTYHN